MSEQDLELLGVRLPAQRRRVVAEIGAMRKVGVPRALLAPAGRAADGGGDDGDAASPQQQQQQQHDDPSSAPPSGIDAFGLPAPQEPPALDEFLHELFVHAAADETALPPGHLHWGVAWAVLASIGLDVSKREKRAIEAVADADGDGLVDWGEFLPIVAPLLKSTYERRLPEGEDVEVARRLKSAFLVLEDAAGVRFLYNKMTCEVAWGYPSGTIEDSFEGAGEA